MLFLGVADEEAGGTWGAGWLAEHAWDEVGARLRAHRVRRHPDRHPAGRRIVMMSGEKGIGWRRLTVHGTPGHGSMPYGADNALRHRPPRSSAGCGLHPDAQLGDHWRAYVDAMGLEDDARQALLDPGRIRDALAEMDPRIARYCHAVTHTTFSPNVIHGGTKTNTIPDRVELEVDIRTLPGRPTRTSTRC